MRIQDRLNKLRNKRGFTLVELMIVVAIIGVLAALAIYGVRKYLANAKTAEARTAVGRIAKDAASAWEREAMGSGLTAGGLIAPGETVSITHALCPNAAAVPTTPPPASKYQSAPADWSGDPGWACLRFTMDAPQYYSYDYTVTAGTSFVARARGDLDGDTTLSSFTLNGAVVGASGEEQIINIAPSIVEADPDE